MNLTQTFVAHAAAAFVVTLLVIAGTMLDARPSYLSVQMVGIFPIVFLTVYIASVVPVVFVRSWAARKEWNAYWQAGLAGAGLGVLLYGGFAALINGREMTAEPGLTLTVLASGVGLGVAGGLTFLTVENYLKSDVGAADK